MTLTFQVDKPVAALILLLLICNAATAFSISSMGIQPLDVRVVSYNVLSSRLSDPSFYSTLNPEHLLPANRYKSVVSKLDREIDRNSIICLQEVSHDWAGSLHAHLSKRGYYMVTALYGSRFNGYMGVAVGWPLAKFTAEDIDICRLSDTREEGWPKSPPQGSFDTLVQGAYSFIRPSLEKLGVLSQSPTDAWSLSQNRNNNLITVKLVDKESLRSFAVATYHMPCAYYAPQVMTIHTDLAARRVQSVVGPDMPYVFAGDWNIKPSSSSYRLLTTGVLDRDDPEYPDTKWGMEWKPTAKPMKSAYAESEFGEPDFTNYSRAGEKEAFIDTLDYIFLSDEWKVASVLELPKRDESGGPFPNLDKDEPSDHVLIAADLRLQD